MPELSVLLTVLNAETYISEAIQSVLDQTYSSFELIVVNDGSTDKTGEIIRAFAVRDSRIVVIELEHNAGTSKALNEGLKIAQGNYITRQDGDDRSLPDRFEKQIKYLEDHPHISAVGSAAYIINSVGERTTVDFLMTDPDEIKYILPDKMCLCGPTVLVRRNNFNTVGYYFSEDLSFSEDFDFCLRLSEIFLISNINQPLYEYRDHPGSVSQSKRFIQIRNKAIALERSLMRQHTDPPPLRLANIIARDYLRASVLAYANKQPNEAEECLSKALFYNPDVIQPDGKLSSILKKYSPKTIGPESIEFLEIVFTGLMAKNKKLGKLKDRLIAQAYLKQVYQGTDPNHENTYLWTAIRHSPDLLLDRGLMKRIIKNLFT